MDKMDSELERRIHAAGSVLQPATRQALDDLVTARIGRAARVAQRRRRLALTGGLTAALLTFGGTAVAASVWGPWSYVPEPDWVLARDWVDANGKPLGSCESHAVLEGYPDEVAQTVRGYLEALDTDALQPDPEWTAIFLKQAGRLDEIDRLLPGTDTDDFDLEGIESGALPDELQATYSDARILQMALEMAAFQQVGQALKTEHKEMLIAEHGTADYIPLESPQQIQCTTEPDRAAGSDG